MNDITFAFLLSLLAGLTAGLGGLIIFFSKRQNMRFLSICLSFSAGVMIYVSFTEIFMKSLEDLEYIWDDGVAFAITTLTFFGGIVFMAIIDKFIPHDDKVFKLIAKKGENSSSMDSEEAANLNRMGLSTAAAIAIHNFPEGLVVFLAALHDPTLGIVIAIAIAIHNIPEGIAVAQPIYYATGSKTKALLITTASGLTEPIGALVGYFLLAQLFNEAVLGISFALVGGIMVYIAFHQLLPTAQKYADHHTVLKSMFIGMAVMALSLVLLEL